MGTERGFTRWERPHSPSEHPSSVPLVTLILLLCPHTAGQGDSRSQGGDSQALTSAGQELLEEPSPSKASQPRPGCDSVSGVPVQGQSCAASTGSCATRAHLLSPRQGGGAGRARTQRFSAPWPGHSGSGLSTAGSSSGSSGPAPCQPRNTAGRWAQPLLSKHCCPGAAQGNRDTLTLSLSPQWDTQRWQQEVTALGLSLEAALREREAAEGHLEALLHNQHQEMQACRQHLLQVGRQGWDSSCGCARAVPDRPGHPAGAAGPAAPGRGAAGRPGAPAPGAAAGGAPGRPGTRRAQPAPAGHPTGGHGPWHHTDTLSHGQGVGTAGSLRTPACTSGARSLASPRHSRLQLLLLRENPARCWEHRLSLVGGLAAPSCGHME